MTDYWEVSKEQREKFDYDLIACLCYNPQTGFELLDIDSVLAVVDGERDERPWFWILKLKDGRHVYMTGSCDYTGWDCQSGATSSIVDTAQAALALAPEKDGCEWRGFRDVRSELEKQLDAGQRKTTEGDRIAQLGGDLPVVDLDVQ